MITEKAENKRTLHRSSEICCTEACDIPQANTQHTHTHNVHTCIHTYIYICINYKHQKHHYQSSPGPVKQICR